MEYTLYHLRPACVSDNPVGSRNRVEWAQPGTWDASDTSQRAAPDLVPSFSVCHAPLPRHVADQNVYCGMDMFS